MARSTGHRDALLVAARRLLREKGYARITARDLVAASNTNLASIGYHFGSKEELLNLAIEAEFAEWVEHVGTVALTAEAATPLERLAIAWATARDSFPAHRALLISYIEAAAQVERSASVRGQLAEQLARSRKRITDMVLSSMPDATPQRQDHARAIATFLVAVCDGLALQWLVDPESVPTGDELAAAFASGLGEA